jgi:hypothetical protein
MSTDQYVTEKLIREQQAEIERLRDRLESSGLRRLNADLERDAAVDDVAHLAGAIVGYVRARRDGLGEVAHWWWELQQIANEIAAPRVASGASIAGVSPSPAPLAPQPSALVAKLLGFTSAYPEDIFPPLTKAEIAELPRGILDRASAAMGRHVAKFVQEAADAVEAQHREIERLERKKAEWSGIAAQRNRNIVLIAEERDRLRNALIDARSWILDSGLDSAMAPAIEGIDRALGCFRPAHDVGGGT